MGIRDLAYRLSRMWLFRDWNVGWSREFSWTGYRMKKHAEIDWSKLIRLGKQLVGKPYVFGSEVNLKDTNPDNIKAIDCSELVEWLYAQVGLNIPDGSYNQFKVTVPIMGEPKLGDLGFKWIPDTHSIHHVGVWIGDQVLEAKGKDFGVVLTPRSKYEGSSHFAMWRRLSSISDA